MPALPLAALWIAAGRRASELFRRLQKRDWGLIALLVVASYAWSIGTAWALGKLGAKTVADAAVGEATGAKGALEAAATLLQLPFLLFAENLFMILPFLFFLMLGYSVLGWARKPSVAVAVVLAGLLFGIYHFKAYDGNWAQMLIVIGLGQVIMAFGYLKTKNLWVSYLTHLIYDGLTFLIVLVVDLADMVAA